MTASAYRLGADIGGTFTDVVLQGPEQRHSTKVLTTHAAPEQAIIDGMQRACEQAGIPTSQISQVVHGTTLATNALIERRGAKTAFITTEGFRDTIEMRTESRFEQYDLNLKLPEPLIARNRRYTLYERIDARGEVLRPLTRDAVENLAERLAQAAYDSIAVGFLHSYVNPSHECLVRDVLANKLPNAMVSISSEVSPQMREYERFNTVCANAYIKPLMKSYLARLAGRLGDAGCAAPILLMHSGGGIISLEAAAEFPVRLVESGPAGGAVFAANLAAQHDLDKVLSFDMGGTTAKICLIKQGAPKTARTFEVARSYRFKKGSGMPISIPVIDMVEIGAGGGSLASVDSMRQIRVGPESTGSEPGPACYGLGGERPAVTDADLVLGKLDPCNFAGGSISLHPERSEHALTAHIGNTLAMDTTTSACGLAEMVDENMANAARMHAVEHGEDLAEYTMIAFGGAAPLHAARLCEKLGIQRFLIPPGAGVGSAIGFLQAPFSFEANRSIYMRLDHFDPDQIQRLFGEMEFEAAGFVRHCDSTADIITEHKAFMRYSGQGWEIPVPLTADMIATPDRATYLESFEAAYRKLFSRKVERLPVEVIVWSVNASTPPATPTPVASITPKPPPSGLGTRDLFDPALGETVPARVCQREAMSSGALLPGPALVIEDETTTVVPKNRRAQVLADGCIDVQVSAAAQ